MSGPRPGAPDALTCLPVTGIGEVAAGADLAALLAAALGEDGLADGDVVVVTSKVVSKAEGRLFGGERSAALSGETVRVLARRGATTIARTRHGLVLAGAGIDGSNTEPGTSLLLPEDPDASARGLRERLADLTGRNVAVVVTDTAGRAWRLGQTDLALGAAGLLALHDYAGSRDGYGNDLAVTAPAVADEIAAAADLVKGKLERRPAAVLRGLAGWVLPPGDHGGGAAVLVREEDQDMFGLGAREAVLAALAGDRTQRTGFGRPAGTEEVVGLLTGLGARVHERAGGVEVRLAGADERAVGRLEASVRAAAFALGWLPTADPGPDLPVSLRFERRTP